MLLRLYAGTKEYIFHPGSSERLQAYTRIKIERLMRVTLCIMSVWLIQSMQCNMGFGSSAAWVSGSCLSQSRCPCWLIQTGLMNLFLNIKVRFKSITLLIFFIYGTSIQRLCMQRVASGLSHCSSVVVDLGL